jgi:hypothetical protein
MTPSSVTWVMTVSFLMAAFLSGCGLPLGPLAPYTNAPGPDRHLPG